MRARRPARATAPAWTLPDDPAERLALATEYPFAAPPRSYLFRDGAAHPIAQTAFAGRRAVLAHGSNRAPSQLARKFAGFRGSASEIPVTYAWLAGYDVVYSAHVTAYGAIASTLTRAPGCRVRVALTWLDDRQLARMHETEGHYGFGRLEAVALTPEAGPPAASTELHLYLSDHGCLLDAAGQPLGLAAVAADGRPHRALDQSAVQRLVRERLDGDDDRDRFILAAIDDPELRRRRIEALQRHAGPSSVPHFVAVSNREPGSRR